MDEVRSVHEPFRRSGVEDGIDYLGIPLGRKLFAGKDYPALRQFAVDEEGCTVCRSLSFLGVEAERESLEDGGSKKNMRSVSCRNKRAVTSNLLSEFSNVGMDVELKFQQAVIVEAFVKVDEPVIHDEPPFLVTVFIFSGISVASLMAAYRKR